jgi:hypothetical protein
MIDWCANHGRRTTTGAPAAREVVGVAGLSGIEKGAHMKSFYLKTAVAAVLLGAATMAIGVPPPGKGNKPPTEVGNSLSVPTIMLGGGAFTGVTCFPNWESAQLTAPSGMPLTGYELNLDAYYFVQKVHPWQAPCVSYGAGTMVDVGGEWGDNLDGDAKLKVGSPIRVELVLAEFEGDQRYGYAVEKLEPSLLDRESAYGTLATDDGLGGYAATESLFTPGVYDAAATFSVLHVDDDKYVVPVGTNPTGEINAKGKVVYGYNLRVSEAGSYVVTFQVPNVVFKALDAGSIVATDTVSISITVIGGGGGGGGKPNK